MPAAVGGCAEMLVRPARRPARIPSTLRSATYTQVVGWPGPCAAVVLSQWLSLPPTAATCAPRSSQPSQYAMLASLSLAAGNGGW